MLSKQPFARRIVIAFTLMTLVVSGVFSLSIVAIVHFIEEHLVSEELDRELNNVLHEDLKQGNPPRLDSSTRFYASNLPQYAIPAEYAGVEDGFSEVLDEQGAHYVYQREINGQRFLLVQEQHEFEAREQALFDVVLACFLLSVAAAWGLGWLVARKVMAPITRLALQVRHRNQLHPLAPALAPEYADDEIGHLAAAFDSTLGQLRQTLDRERLFTSDVSHELRTPLMVITTSCELLEQAPLQPRQHEQIRRISRAADEMNNLVQTFLTLARNQSQGALAAGHCSLASIAHGQAELWGQAIRDKGLVFELLEEASDTGRYNETLLSSVMSNLLRNALHYTNSGSVRLILEAGGFRVEDTGLGVALEQQGRIFQPFIRGEESRGEGLGLGLSLVKRICSQQGWQVGMEKLSPAGSRFHVRFSGPVADAGVVI